MVSPRFCPIIGSSSICMSVKKPFFRHRSRGRSPLEGTETTARQAADTAVQILHLFESDRKKIRAMGRKAASSLAVHEYLQAHPLTKIGPAAKDLKLSIPTVTSALGTLTKLKIAKESTGKRRDRLFAYPRYLNILSEGTEPLRS